MKFSTKEIVMTPVILVCILCMIFAAVFRQIVIDFLDDYKEEHPEARVDSWVFRLKLAAFIAIVLVVYGLMRALV